MDKCLLLSSCYNVASRPSMAEYSEVARMRCTFAQVDDVAEYEIVRSFPAVRLLSTLVYHFRKDPDFGYFTLSDFRDASTSSLTQSPLYQGCAKLAFMKRTEWLAENYGVSYLALWERKNDTTLVFRYYIATKALLKPRSNEVLRAVFGSVCPKFNERAVQHFACVMSKEGLESTPPDAGLSERVVRSGVVTRPIKFQLNALEAMRVLEDPVRQEGMGRVYSRACMPTIVWPQDSVRPLCFNALTMSFTKHSTPPVTQTGGLLGLGPGLGKTFIVIVHTMLYRDQAIAKKQAAPNDICAIGTVVVAEPYLHDHWRSQIALHAPTATVGDRDNLYHERPYVDFIVVSANALLAFTTRSDERLNRICYDEAHKLDPRLKRADIHAPRADSVWAVTATPGHAKYLRDNFDNILKVLHFPKVDTISSLYFPDVFSGLRDMIISGAGVAILDELLPDVITTNTYAPLNAHDLEELESIRNTASVDLSQPHIVREVVSAVLNSIAYNATVVNIGRGFGQYTTLQLVEREGLFMDDDCCICYSAFTRPVAVPCKHVYCYDCLRQAGMGTCPMCRVPFDAADVKAVVSAAVEGPLPYASNSRTVWKFTTAVDVVTRAVQENEARPGSGKTIIFCDTDFVVPMSTHLRAEADLRSLWCLQDMEERRRTQAVDAFKADPSKRILVIDISLNAGLDLPCADNIIFANRVPISPDSHVFKQAIGRVRRLSQKSGSVRANVIHFQSRSTIEEILCPQ